MKLVARLFLAVATFAAMGTLVSVPVRAQGLPALRFLGLSPTQPPADSLTSRLAVAHAIDRDTIVRATMAVSAMASPALSIQHPRVAGHNPAARVYPYDQARARERYTRSGWTATISIMVPSPTNRFWELFNNAVADGLRNTLGASVTLQVVTPFRALVDAVRAGQAALYMFGWASVPRDYGYPSFALGLAHDNDIADPEIRALVEKRDAAALEQLLLERALIVPIIHYVSQG
ncbi:MAG: ABC transporter substrate-binding protein [Armatimonadota bacterium]|nr:ABC transporter substrate-binding protein [Armatimonadota bacterium]